MNVLFFGMAVDFSRRLLEILLAGGVNVSAVVLPARDPAAGTLPHRLEPPRPISAALPVLNPYLTPHLVHLAWERHLPAWEVGRLAEPATLALLADLQPDLIAVACFPRLFPERLRRLPRHGCLNLHPSLLPAYRGPAPLFWQARQAERRTGVSLHFLDGGVDTGDIVAQAGVAWPEGGSGTEFEERCAVEGGRLLLAAVQELQQGWELARQPQPQAGSSYFPWPAEADFIIPTGWPARRAFHFLRGAADWPLVIAAGGQRLAVRSAVAYDPAGKLDKPYLLQGDEILVQFTPGVLRARWDGKAG